MSAEDITYGTEIISFGKVQVFFKNKRFYEPYT